MGRLVTIALIILTALHGFLLFGGITLQASRANAGDEYFSLSMGVGLALCLVAFFWQIFGRRSVTRVKLRTQFGIVVLMLTMTLFGMFTGAFMALHVEEPNEDHYVGAMVTGFIYAGCGMAIWHIRRKLVRATKNAIAEVF